MKRTVVQATYGNWSRLIVVPEFLPPFIAFPPLEDGQAVMESMIKKYILKDGDLDMMELYQLCNWCFNYHFSKYSSAICRVDIREMTDDEISDFLDKADIV